MRASAVSTITKSLPIALSVLVNYSLLATLGYINLFLKKISINFIKTAFYLKNQSINSCTKCFIIHNHSKFRKLCMHNNMFYI